MRSGAAIPLPSSPVSLSALRVLLVEDDPGDAVLAQEYLAGSISRLEWVRSVNEACAVLVSWPADCVLLDLNLPDTVGFDGVRRIRRAAPGAAVVVLTGDGDADRGLAAVAAGAQDYLVKNEVDGPLLTRALRYAAERMRTESSLAELRAAQIRQEENARLERGLLPVPLLGDAPVSVVTRYRPGRAQSMLGGDFFDLVQTDDGRVWALVGDVAGHGPDEAALGVCLRVGWRALVLAGLDPGDIFPALQRLLVQERPGEEVFATACMVLLDPEAVRATVFVAGHPSPLLVEASSIAPVPASSGIALGILDDADWPGTELSLGPRWSLMCYTDGLIEGLFTPPADPTANPSGDPPTRLGEAGLVDILQRHGAGPGRSDVAAMVADVVEEVQARNGGPLADDLAILYLSRRKA